MSQSLPPGQIVFWEGGSLWVGLNKVRSEMHAHHAIQIGLTFNGAAQLKTARDKDWVAYSGYIIPSRLAHAFQAPDTLVANLFCDPDSDIGRKLEARTKAGTILALTPEETASLVEPLKSAFLAGADRPALIDAAKSIMQEMASGVGFRHPVDPRIQQAVAHIHKSLAEPLTLADVAALVRLSEGRLRHLFVEQTGLHFRGYILWARLNRALELGFSGISWTEAAHAANFSDAAHLTRTCQRMYGFAPTLVQKGRTTQRPSSA